MKLKGGHLAQDELLRMADGELSPADNAMAQVHLNGCEDCRERMARIAATMSDVVSAQRNEFRATIADGDEARGAFRSRLAELSHETAPARRTVWGMPMDWKTAVYACVGIALAAALLAPQRPVGTTITREYSPSPKRNVALPDPKLTPGFAREAQLADVCAMQKDEVVMNVGAAVQDRVFREYGIADRKSSDFEVDYLITPGLGGSDDIRNLWPEPHTQTEWNSFVKDQLEDRLHGMVCSRKIGLTEAQQEIANNWIEAYKKYFQTDRPLAVSASASASASTSFSISTAGLQEITFNALSR